MDILSNLSKSTQKSSKRVGRGYGSKKGGHTTGRGAKGDNVRGKTKLTFDGSKIKKGWIKRMPFMRGKHRLTSKYTFTIINLDQLNKWFKNNETVDLTSLSKKSTLSLSELNHGVKILGWGKLEKALTISKLTVSRSAQSKIISAGGKID
jgi:large subunit ribosomal protein L15